MFCWLLPESSLCSRNVKIQSFRERVHCLEVASCYLFLWNNFHRRCVCFHENPAVLGGFQTSFENFPIREIPRPGSQYIRLFNLPVSIVLDEIYFHLVCHYFCLMHGNDREQMPCHRVLSKCHSPPGIIFTSQL